MVVNVIFVCMGHVKVDKSNEESTRLLFVELVTFCHTFNLPLYLSFSCLILKQIIFFWFFCQLQNTSKSLIKVFNKLYVILAEENRFLKLLQLCGPVLLAPF